MGEIVCRNCVILLWPGKNQCSYDQRRLTMLLGNAALISLSFFIEFITLCSVDIFLEKVAIWVVPDDSIIACCRSSAIATLMRIVFHTFLGQDSANCLAVNGTVTSLPGCHPKYLKFCSEDEQIFYGFGTT